MPTEARKLRLPTGEDAFEVTISESKSAGVPVPAARTYTCANAFASHLESAATGFGTIVWAKHDWPDLPRIRDSLPLIEMPATGYGWLRHLMTRCLLYETDPRELDETGPTLLVFMTNWHSASAIDVETFNDPPSSTPEADAAQQIRELSGLKPAKLAELFGVSRKAFYDWLDGALPRDATREHLLEVAKLIEEASTRFGGSRELSSWLLTPVSPGGRTPFELLKEGRAASFRGFSLRSKSVPVGPLRRVREDLGPSAASEGLQRAARRPAADDISDIDFEDAGDAL